MAAHVEGLCFMYSAAAQLGEILHAQLHSTKSSAERNLAAYGTGLETAQGIFCLLESLHSSEYAKSSD